MSARLKRLAVCSLSGHGTSIPVHWICPADTLSHRHVLCQRESLSIEEWINRVLGRWPANSRGNGRDQGVEGCGQVAMDDQQTGCCEVFLAASSRDGFGVSATTGGPGADDCEHAVGCKAFHCNGTRAVADSCGLDSYCQERPPLIVAEPKHAYAAGWAMTGWHELLAVKISCAGLRRCPVWSPIMGSHRARGQGPTGSWVAGRETIAEGPPLPCRGRGEKPGPIDPGSSRSGASCHLGSS